MTSSLSRAVPLAVVSLVAAMAGAHALASATPGTQAVSSDAVLRRAPAAGLAPGWASQTGSQPVSGPRAPLRPVEAQARMAHRWAWPLSPQPRIVRLFSRPQQRYGPGHRGLDLEGQPGALVRAVDAGTVTHVGVVAGRGTVTLVHASGLRSTYEPVTASVKAGQAVGRGAVLGHLVPEGGHCPGRVCLHLGAIQLSDYIDPLPLLERHGVRLLPLR